MHPDIHGSETVKYSLCALGLSTLTCWKELPIDSLTLASNDLGSQVRAGAALAPFS